MENNKVAKDYNWIILFFLSISAIIRLFMHIYKFTHIDIFIAIINLIGLDYTLTSIVNSIYRNKVELIDESKIVNQAKINKKKKHKTFIYVNLFILMLYNIFHLLLSCSVANDMLSMVVLGISFTDNSIISFFVKNTKI